MPAAILTRATSLKGFPGYRRVYIVDDFIGCIPFSDEAKIYTVGNSRPELSYYLHARGIHCRHAIIRHLERLDWAEAEKSWLDAIKAGETFVLTGEDMGIYPGTDMPTQGLFENHALSTLQRMVNSADRIEIPKDWPTTLICLFGKGRFILDRTSLDETYPPDNWGQQFIKNDPSAMGEWVKQWRNAWNCKSPSTMPVKQVDLAPWLFETTNIKSATKK